MTDKIILAIDLGGTKLAYQLVSTESVFASAVEPTSKNFESQLKRIYQVLLNEFKRIDIVSIGVPGPVLDGVMGPSFPLKTTSPVSFNALFGDSEKVIIRNDMQMAAHAELIEGEGRHFKNFCLVSLSTGIGVGVVIEKRVLNFRGEMGHQLIMHRDKKNWQCLNHQDCWASVCSGEAFERNGFSANDYDFLREVNTIAFANLICAYDPEVIFVMGGVGRNLFDNIIPTKFEVAKKINIISAPEIQLTSVFGEIGVIGAIALAKTC